MGHAADFDHAFLETSFVASKVIAHQFAVPCAEEITRMLTRTAQAEVINHGLKRRERRSAVSPDIGTMGFLSAGCEHLHRCLVGVDNSLRQNRFSQSINQCLKLYAGLSDPVGQC